MAVMAKKKAVLYIEIPDDLKKALAGLAERRSRKITAEATIAIRRYVEQELAKEAEEEDPDA